MDFFDNVVKSSNAIIKDKIKNPFNQSKLSEPFRLLTDPLNKASSQPQSSAQDSEIPTQSTSTADQTTTTSKNETNAPDTQQTSVQDSDQQQKADMNAQFAAIAADAQAVGQKTVEGAKNIGNFLFSMGLKAGQTVSQTAHKVKQVVENTSIMADFTREQQEFIKEHGGGVEAGPLPWSDITDEAKREDIKKQILSLTQNKRNFVKSPPNEASFQFDSKQCYPVALSLLKEDSNLSKLRFELVPKLVSEDSFWCNYFYRIDMLKKMSSEGTKSWSSSRSSSGEGPDLEAHGVSDEDALEVAPIPEKSVVHTEEKRQSLDGESKKLIEEAEDLKTKLLRELNIGSLDEHDG